MASHPPTSYELFCKISTSLACLRPTAPGKLILPAWAVAYHKATACWERDTSGARCGPRTCGTPSRRATSGCGEKPSGTAHMARPAHCSVARGSPVGLLPRLRGAVARLPQRLRGRRCPRRLGTASVVTDMEAGALLLRTKDWRATGKYLGSIVGHADLEHFLGPAVCIWPQDRWQPGTGGGGAHAGRRPARTWRARPPRTRHTRPPRRPHNHARTRLNVRVPGAQPRGLQRAFAQQTVRVQVSTRGWAATRAYVSGNPATGLSCSLCPCLPSSACLFSKPCTDYLF